MNSNDLQKIRLLLNDLSETERPLVLSKEDESGYVDCPYSDAAINWMNSNKLIIQVDELESRGITIQVFLISELGRMLSQFQLLADYLYTDNQEYFITAGNLIFSVLKMYNEYEIEPLIQILTLEEQEAYQHFYKTQIWVTGNRQTETETCETNKISIDDINHNGLINMFSLSVLLGEKDDNDRRTTDYVLKKCLEELGELSLELQIDAGLSYKEPGADGVEGEAVDLAICAMDMFALQYPGLPPKLIEAEFYKKMNEKLEKWVKTLGM